MSSEPTLYELIRKKGASRRSFLKFCAMTAAMMGLPPARATELAEALESRPRIPVVWMHGLECTCCTESFIRSAHPLASDVLLSMISLDVDETLMAAAGHQAEELAETIMERYRGNYILAVEGNPPLHDDGWYCIVGGEPFIDKLRRAARHAKAIIAWGSCASNGCVQAASPNPTGATPIHKVIHDKPIVRVPGCPPIAEVMSGVLVYMLSFGRLPPLDNQLRPKMFYSQRIHDKCYRRSHFDAGQFVENWDDEGAAKGYCLYKMGCRGPTTYNACSSTRWNDGVSFPIQSGHGCLGCSEDGFWDRDPFYSRLPDVNQFDIEGNADTIGLGAVATAGAFIGVHAAGSAVQRFAQKREEARKRKAAAQDRAEGGETDQ